MLRLQKTYVTAFVSFLFCIFALIAVAFFLRMTLQSGYELVMRVETIANNSAREKAYVDLQKLIDATESMRTELKSLIILESNMSTFLTDLETLGTTQGVTLTTDSLEVKKQEGIFNQLTVRFTISGSKSDVMRMVTLFETLPYVNNLTKLTVEHFESESKANIELVVIVLKENV